MRYTKEEFIDYLEQTLIPDLIESGSSQTALDFAACVWFMFPINKEVDFDILEKHLEEAKQTGGEA
tara:strand:- start:165 stop:362 length:198 start_codon:yes stop_codon:yes gene_type:complete